jgi:hypothetical protein
MIRIGPDKGLAGSYAPAVQFCGRASGVFLFFFFASLAGPIA